MVKNRWVFKETTDENGAKRPEKEDFVENNESRAQKMEADW